MSLSRLVGAVANYLTAALAPATPMIGGAEPSTDSELPAVAIWVTDVDTRLTGIGGLPRASRRGALRIDRQFDLAAPTLTFPDGESVNLLSPDRTVLHFPFGPVVAHDGTEVAALAPADLDVAVDGNPLTVTTDPPAAGQVQGLTREAELRFGAAVPATGTLAIGFFVGEWQVTVTRYQGLLHLKAFDDSAAAADALSRAVEDAMALAAPGGVAGLIDADQASFGPISIPWEPKKEPHNRLLTYRFDYELEAPLLATGGGPIGTLEVEITFPPEQFDVVREGSPT